MAQFDRVWSSDEPDFVNYFHQNYENRTGTQTQLQPMQTYQLDVHLLYIHVATFTYIQLCVIMLEKWAKCYRHFDHGDTDTNMYVER